MSLKYLFGPVSREFAEQSLAEPQRTVECLAFNAEGDVDLKITKGDGWESVLARLPTGWTPDFVALCLPLAPIPPCLWSAPLVRVGIAHDCGQHWHAYRRLLPGCHVVYSDHWTTERLKQDGITHARPADLHGCGRAFDADASGNAHEGPNADASTEPHEYPRDIDVLVLTNPIHAHSAEPMSWLAHLARLTARWQVQVRPASTTDSFRKILARSRIVLHRRDGRQSAAHAL